MTANTVPSPVIEGPVYVCKNAHRREHDCKFMLCMDCYTKNGSKRNSVRTRGRGGLNRTSENSLTGLGASARAVVACEHDDLTRLELVIDPSWRKVLDKDGYRKMPDKCCGASCGRRFQKKRAGPYEVGDVVSV